MATPADQPSDWQLLYFGTRYRKWVAAASPLPNQKADVRRWARIVTRRGPSFYAIPITPSGEDFTEMLPDSNVVVAYAVVDSEELVILLDIY